MLERLLYLEMNMQMQILVISAPKLETLGCIPEKYTDSKIVFGSTVIQVDMFVVLIAFFTKHLISCIFVC
jgi:hypothetical protein